MSIPARVATISMALPVSLASAENWIEILPFVKVILFSYLSECNCHFIPFLLCSVTDQSFTNEENKCTGNSALIPVSFSVSGRLFCCVVTLSASEVCTASCAGDEYCRIKAGNVRCCRLQRIKSTSFAGKVDRCSESCVLPIPPKPG